MTYRYLGERLLQQLCYEGVRMGTRESAQIIDITPLSLPILTVQMIFKPQMPRAVNQNFTLRVA